MLILPICSNFIAVFVTFIKINKFVINFFYKKVSGKFFTDKAVGI